ncbi:cupin domain-containing protein [Rhodococcus aerolatus]
MSPLPGWAQGLGLAPHPEGGWYVRTWASDVEVSTAGGPRPAGTAILYLLLPGEVSAWHVVASAELWCHHRGSPLALGLGGADPAGPAQACELLLGGDVAVGQHPQLLVPARTWQTARPLGDEPALLSCVVVPGFDMADFRLA